MFYRTLSHYRKDEASGRHFHDYQVGGALYGDYEEDKSPCSRAHMRLVDANGEYFPEEDLEKGIVAVFGIGERPSVKLNIYEMVRVRDALHRASVAALAYGANDNNDMMLIGDYENHIYPKEYPIDHESEGKPDIIRIESLTREEIEAMQGAEKPSIRVYIAGYETLITPSKSCLVGESLLSAVMESYQRLERRRDEDMKNLFDPRAIESMKYLIEYFESSQRLAIAS